MAKEKKSEKSKEREGEIGSWFRSLDEAESIPSVSEASGGMKGGYREFREEG